MELSKDLREIDVHCVHTAHATGETFVETILVLAHIVPGSSVRIREYGVGFDHQFEFLFVPALVNHMLIKLSKEEFGKLTLSG